MCPYNRHTEERPIDRRGIKKSWDEDEAKKVRLEQSDYKTSNAKGLLAATWS